MKRIKRNRSKKKSILSVSFMAALMIGLLGTAVAFAADGKQTGKEIQQETLIPVEEANEEFAPGDPNGDATEGEPTAEQEKEENPTLEKLIEVESVNETFAPDGDATEE